MAIQSFNSRMQLLSYMMYHINEGSTHAESGLYHIGDDRSGVGTWNMTGVHVRYDLANGDVPFDFARALPKRMYVEELNWFLQGKESTDYLKEKNVPFWDKWTVERDNGVNSIGPMYPVQWRKKKVYCGHEVLGFHPDGSYRFGQPQIGTIDQIQNVVDLLKNNPSSRRIYISNIDQGLHPIAIVSPQENVMNGNMALDPCHCFFQMTVRDVDKASALQIQEYEKERRQVLLNAGIETTERPMPTKIIDGMLTMRSNDLPVGAPANIFQYSLLMHYLAHVLGYAVGEYTHSVGSAHIYSTQLDGVRQELDHHQQFTSENPIHPKMYLSDNITMETFLTGTVNPDDILMTHVPLNTVKIQYALEG